MAPSAGKKNLPLNLRIQRQGIRQVLGDLEADVMECIWAQSPASVRDVHESLSLNRNIAYTTVMTVMTRLADKGILNRKQDGRAYLYTPVQTRDDFCSQAIGTVMKGLLGGFGEPVLSQFVDTVSAEDTANLDQLLRLIEKKKGESEPSAT